MSVNVKQNGELTPVARLTKIIVPLGIAECYSTEEKQVGCWHDGKPLYQKTFVTERTNIAGNSSIDISSYVSSLDIEEIVDYTERILYSVSGGTGEYYSDDIARLRKIGSSYDITLTIGSATLSSIKIEWTIQYTKISDVAGSGMWTPNGNYAEHYSTEEQVIGTWHDGKPVYERVFTFNAISMNINAWYDTGVDISYVREIVFASVHNNTWALNCICAFKNGTKLNLVNMGNGNLSANRVIMRYTKTADYPS